ncbi:MAG: hypothetical protein H5U40_02285 [Polyangiaceae bacterium]|nr:hypothetical protein [Polyangiaceae bacterium]
MHFLRRVRFAVFVALLFASAPPPSAASAQARTDDTSARTHFEAATEYYRRGAYGDAEREFLAAYELSHRPELLYNVYLARERIGNFAGAAEALRQYLAEVAEVDERDALEARLVNLEARAAAEAEEQPRQNEAAPAAATGPRVSETRPRVGVPALIAYGVGGAGLVTFAVAGGLAIAEDSSLAESCGRDAGRTCSADEVAGLRRRTLTADIGLGVGLAGAVTGVVLTFVGRDPNEDERALTVRPAFTASSVGLVAQGRF